MQVSYHIYLYTILKDANVSFQNIHASNDFPSTDKYFIIDDAYHALHEIALTMY